VLRSARFPAALLLSLLVAPAAVADELIPVIARPRTRAEVDRIWQLADHVLAPHDPGGGAHALAIRPSTLQRLRAEGIDLRVQDADLHQLLAPAPPEPLLAVHAPGRLGIFDEFWSHVRTLDEIDRRLDQLAQISNGRALVLELGRSIEGRPIRALRILAGGDTAADRVSRPAILITGTHHAREWASPMVTVGLAEALVRGYLSDPRVRRVLNRLAVFVVPVVNVDGYVATHNGQRLRRKNMNHRCAVDLNRNYEVAFGLGSPEDGCNEENYPGPFPFSEPETRAIKALADSLANLKLFLDYHAPAEQVMIPFAYTRERPPDFERSRARAEQYAATVKLLYGTVHPAREGYDLAQGQGGGGIDWFRTRGCESFAVELRDGRDLAGFELPPDQLIPSAEENWTAFLELAGALAEEERPPGSGPADEILGGGTESLVPPAIAAVGCSVASAQARPAAWTALAGLFLLALLRLRRRQRPL
jgi:MYXO-CTERM domain-containing protein